MTSRPFPSIACSFRIFCGSLLATAALTSPLLAQAPPTAPTATWAKREVSGAQFDAPFDVKESVDLAASLPPEVKEKVEAMSSAMGGSEGSFIVFVVSSTYKAGVALNLDGAVKGMVNGIAAKVGDTNPQYTSNPVKVSGAEARRGTYQKSFPDGRPLHLEFVVIARGQTLWQVQALTMIEKNAPDVARVLASVAIKPAP